MMHRGSLCLAFKLCRRHQRTQWGIILGEVNLPPRLKLRHQQVGTSASRAHLSVHTTGVCLGEVEAESLQGSERHRCPFTWLQLWMFCTIKSNTRGGPSVFGLWLLKHTLAFNFCGVKSATHFLTALWPGAILETGMLFHLFTWDMGPVKLLNRS